jgi:arylsulfatase A-like enzyme
MLQTTFDTGGRMRAVTALALLTLLVLAPLDLRPGRNPRDHRPNVVVILTDDQTLESLHHQPSPMPWLTGRLADPEDHWLELTNAFVNTPLCCPSRSTLLTGRYSHHTGVLGNHSGQLLDESQTIATWLHDAGYWTGLFGKYLNGFPFGRGPYVPPGWDRFSGKQQGNVASVYFGYTLLQNGVARTYGTAPEDYSTDVLAGQAVRFISDAPPDRPFLLLFTPTAPHGPRTPAPRYARAFDGAPVPRPPDLGEPDVSDKPAWVRGLPQPTSRRRRLVDGLERRQYATLLAVDDAVRAIMEALSERGELERTVIVFTTDNGFSMGAHRWITKSCPYEECVHVPFLVRFPGGRSGVDDRLVSNVDIAPTLMDLAGAPPGLAPDGRSLVPLLRKAKPRPWREGVLLEWAGGMGVPPWWEVRTEDYSYTEYATGEVELYELSGRRGPADPFQLQNIAGDPAYGAVRARLAALLEDLRAGTAR